MKFAKLSLPQIFPDRQFFCTRSAREIPLYIQIVVILLGQTVAEWLLGERLMKNNSRIECFWERGKQRDDEINE